MDRSKTKAYLPYDMVFTLIFINSKVNLEREDFEVLAHIDYSIKWSLHRIEYRKVDDQWVRKGDDDPNMHQIKRTPSSSPFSSSPPSPSLVVGLSSPASTVGLSSLATTPALATAVGHFFGASVPPHTPHMHQTFTIERRVEQIVKRVGAMFSNFKQ